MTALDEAELVLIWEGRLPDKHLLQSAKPCGTGTLHMLQRAAQCLWDTNTINEQLMISFKKKKNTVDTYQHNQNSFEVNKSFW